MLDWPSSSSSWGRTEITSSLGPKLDRRFLDRWLAAALGRRANAHAGGQQRRAPSRARRCVFLWLLGAAVVALGPAAALAAAGKKHVSAHKSTKVEKKSPKHGSTSDKGRKAAQRRGGGQEVVERIPFPRERPPTEGPAAAKPAVKTLPPDFDAAKQAIGLVRKGKSSEATALARSIGDPVAQKLVEWALLRSESGASFERYAAFIRANPHWPSIPRSEERRVGKDGESRCARHD